jgi:hypothetical protein
MSTKHPFDSSNDGLSTKSPVAWLIETATGGVMSTVTPSDDITVDV